MTIRKSLAWNSIPPHMADALERYVVHRIRPGGFLEAFLSNDLMGAIRRADGTNINLFRAYGQILYMDLPSNCHGSPAIVQKYLENEQ